jgi:hypothetical protein
VIATTLGNHERVHPRHGGGPVHRHLSLREATIAGLADATAVSATRLRALKALVIIATFDHVCKRLFWGRSSRISFDFLRLCFRQRSVHNVERAPHWEHEHVVEAAQTRLNQSP